MQKNLVAPGAAKPPAKSFRQCLTPLVQGFITSSGLVGCCPKGVYHPSNLRTPRWQRYAATTYPPKTARDMQNQISFWWLP